MADIEREKVVEFIKNYGKGAIEDGLKTLDPVDDIILLKKALILFPPPNIVQPVEAPIQIGNGRWQKGTTVYKCPNCKEWVSKTYKHCPDCGQALDWSDSE